MDGLESDSLFTSHKCAKEGLSDMSMLFGFLRAYGVLDKFSFDLSPARGLDYYTGIIYEAIVEANAPPGFKTNADASAEATTTDTPVGASAPVSKEHVGDEEEVDGSQVGIGSIAAGPLPFFVGYQCSFQMQADFLAKAKPKIDVQFAVGERDEVPFAVVLGADEL